MLTYLKEINQEEYALQPNTYRKLLLMIFVFGGFFGFLYEELFYLIDLGYLVKRGTTFGPWIPIYGFGALFIVLITTRFNQNPPAVFGISCLVSGLLEFLTGYTLFHAWDLRLWDYNIEIWNWGNVGGYICFRSIAFFGVSGLFFQYIVYPLLARFAVNSKETKLSLVSLVPASLFLLDIVVSLVFRVFFPVAS